MTSRRKPPGAKERLYTFDVSFSFSMQFTFTEKEVQPSEEGGENDVDPTDEALAELEQEIKEYLSEQYSVSGFEIFADFDSLLGVEEVTRQSKHSSKVKASVSEKRSQKTRRQLRGARVPSAASPPRRR